jgi:7,8-dihydropterin-6-yl-methyl-4-(beta-D-ribofuranosyl)aminobenzene 5'-phosphate synthase
MRIQNLIENTKGCSGVDCAHGFSFYIETTSHKLLVDLGPSEVTLENAKKLDIDLKKVDTVVLSHGHYDHSGGIMPFTKINNQATIYMQALAEREYYADDGVEAGRKRYRYIGIDPEISKLDKLKKIGGNFKIDEELELFTIKERTHPLPFTNDRLLVKKPDGFVKDDFKHEQFLVIRDDNKSVLISGCAHNGILSIMDDYIYKYKSTPDYVISGFHLKKNSDYTEDEVKEIKEIANVLKTYNTKFYTCHCTGLPAFDMMKEIMGDQLEYVHSGDEVKLA